MTLTDLMLRLLQKHLLISFSERGVSAKRACVRGRLGHMSSFRRLMLEDVQSKKHMTFSERQKALDRWTFTFSFYVYYHFSLILLVFY